MTINSHANSNRIAKNALMLYFRMLLIMAITLYTSRVVLEVLGVEDFGIYNVVGGIVLMFSFLNTAMASGTQRFLSYELGGENSIRFKRTFQVSLNIHFCVAFIVFLLAETIGLWFLNVKMNISPERMEAAKWIYQFSIFSCLVSILQVPYNAIIIAYERMNVYAYVSILEVFLKLFIVFILVWVDYDKLKLYAILMFGVVFTIAFIYQLYCRLNFKECRFALVRDRTMYSILIGYAGWNLFGNVAVVGFNQGVNLLLNVFFGPIVNAARAIAFQVNAAIQSFIINFQLAVNPQIIKSYASGEKEYMMILVYQSSKYSFFLLSILAVPILFEADFILYLWLGEVPDYTILFCRLIIVNAMIDSFSGPLMTAAQATGRIKKYQSFVGTILLLNLPISYVFLKIHYQPEVTIYVSMFLSVIALICRLWILRELLNFNIYFYVRNIVFLSCITILIASACPTIIMYLLPYGWSRFIILTLLSVIFSLLSVYLMGLTKKEKFFIKNKIKYIVNRGK